MRILITGTNGFIGGHLVRKLNLEGNAIVRFARGSQLSRSASTFSGPEKLSAIADRDSCPWPEGIEAVVHLAAKTSVDGNGADEIFESNVGWTQALTQRARAEGVKRIIFLSTANVHGLGRAAPYSERDPLEPPNLYAQSKLAAEEAFWDALGNEREIGTILRPPPVFGKGGHGRIAALARLAKSPLLLPIEGMGAPRSVIAVDHLAEIIALCLRSGASRGEALLVADDEPVRPEDIVRYVRQGRERTAGLLPAPVRLLGLTAKLAGRKSVWELRTRPCILDTTRMKMALGWKSPVPTSEKIRAMAAAGEL